MQMLWLKGIMSEMLQLEEGLGVQKVQTIFLEKGTYHFISILTLPSANLSSSF